MHLMTKHAALQATQEGRADLPSGDTEGGETPDERRCTYLDLALCLTPGLDDQALHVLVTAALPALQVVDSSSLSLPPNDGFSFLVP